MINGWGYQNILDHYAVNAPTLVSYLLKLEKLRIIDLLPGNRIKLLISPNFSWRNNGPVHLVLSQIVLKTFLEGDIDKSGGVIHFVSGMLSEESHAEILKLINQLTMKFNERKHQDHDLPFHLRHGFSLALAIRPWRKEVIQNMLDFDGK